MFYSAVTWISRYHHFLLGKLATRHRYFPASHRRIVPLPVPLQFHGHLPQHTAQPKTEVSPFPQCPQTWILNLWFCGLLWFDLRLNAEQFWNQIMSKFDTYILSFGAKFSIRKKKLFKTIILPSKKCHPEKTKSQTFRFELGGVSWQMATKL